MLKDCSKDYYSHYHNIKFLDVIYFFRFKRCNFYEMKRTH